MITTLNQYDKHAVAVINQNIPGWSGYAQYRFFMGMMGTSWPRRMLMLGVYQGRDLAYICDILLRYFKKRLEAKEISIIGVDKFSDTPCADWPKGPNTWGETEFGAAPSLEQAQKNLGPVFSFVELVKSDDKEFLDGNPGKFDFIYLDTAHDYETVKRQIKQCVPLLNSGGVISGDDYLERDNWGVIQAVRESFPRYMVFKNCIWVVQPEETK
jgi:Methyltransferase domain